MEASSDITDPPKTDCRSPIFQRTAGRRGRGAATSVAPDLQTAEVSSERTLRSGEKVLPLRPAALRLRNSSVSAARPEHWRWSRSVATISTEISEFQRPFPLILQSSACQAQISRRLGRTDLAIALSRIFPAASPRTSLLASWRRAHCVLARRAISNARR